MERLEKAQTDTHVHIAQTSPEWRQLLDVGLLDNVTVAPPRNTGRQQEQQKEQQQQGPELVHVPARGFVHTLELARFKWVSLATTAALQAEHDMLAPPVTPRPLPTQTCVSPNINCRELH